MKTTRAYRVHLRPAPGAVRPERQPRRGRHYSDARIHELLLTGALAEADVPSLLATIGDEGRREAVRCLCYFHFTGQHTLKNSGRKRAG